MFTKNITLEKDPNPELFATRRKAAIAAERKQLLQVLNRGVKLGNFYNEPVTIEYLDGAGESKKHEVILSTVTENYAITRGELFIHLDKIKKVII